MVFNGKPKDKMKYCWCSDLADMELLHVRNTAVEKLFDDIFSFVRMVAPAAKIELRDFYGT